MEIVSISGLSKLLTLIYCHVHKFGQKEKDREEIRRQACKAHPKKKKSDRELELEIKNKGDEFRWKNNMKSLYLR